MTTTDTRSLGDALPAKMKEIREVFIPAYRSVPNSDFAILLMNSALTRAEKAMAEGDIVEMMGAYQELQEFKL